VRPIPTPNAIGDLDHETSTRALKERPIFSEDFKFRSCLQHSGARAQYQNPEFHSGWYRACRWHFVVSDNQYCLVLFTFEKAACHMKTKGGKTVSEEKQWPQE
jgi:hypothetical protein